MLLFDIHMDSKLWFTVNKNKTFSIEATQEYKLNISCL